MVNQQPSPAKNAVTEKTEPVVPAEAKKAEKKPAKAIGETEKNAPKQPAVATLLKSKDINERVTGLRSLKANDPKLSSYSSTIISMLTDTKEISPEAATVLKKSTTLQAEASRALIKGGPAFEKSLIKSLKNNDPVIRAQSAIILGEQKSKKATKHLVKLLADTNVVVAEKASEALANSASTQSMVKALRTKDENAKLALIDILSKQDPKVTIDPLIAELQSPSASVRERVAVVLGDMKSKKAVDPLITALKDKISFVRGNAAEALGKLGDPKAASGLSELTKDQSEMVREKATEALAVMAKAEFRAIGNDFESLVKALGHANPQIREKSANKLWVMTGQKFGYDQKQWTQWWESNKKADNTKKK